MSFKKPSLVFARLHEHLRMYLLAQPPFECCKVSVGTDSFGSDRDTSTWGEDFKGAQWCSAECMWEVSYVEKRIDHPLRVRVNMKYNFELFSELILHNGKKKEYLCKLVYSSELATF